jgi:hypothetical protein
VTEVKELRYLRGSHEHDTSARIPTATRATAVCAEPQAIIIVDYVEHEEEIAARIGKSFHGNPQPHVLGLILEAQTQCRTNFCRTELTALSQNCGI